jgi:hypothetical protein
MGEGIFAVSKQLARMAMKGSLIVLPARMMK